MIVNFPTTQEGKELLEDNIAIFKATLILETIKGLNISTKEKKEVLDNIIKELKTSKTCF